MTEVSFLGSEKKQLEILIEVKLRKTLNDISIQCSL